VIGTDPCNRTSPKQLANIIADKSIPDRQRGEERDVQCFHPNYQLLEVFIRKISIGLASNSAAAMD
jgi:hypothetical protein